MRSEANFRLRECQLLEIDPDGDLPLHPSLLVEPEGTVLTIVTEILYLQALDGSHACAGVGQCPDHGAVDHQVSGALGSLGACLPNATS